MVLDFPFSRSPVLSGQEAFLQLDVRLAENTCWAVSGHLVAWEQLRLDFPVLPAAEPSFRNLKMVKSDQGFSQFCTEGVEMLVLRLR